MSKVPSGQHHRYDQLYQERSIDPNRPDTPSITLRHLGDAGLLEGKKTLLDIGSGIGKDVRLAVTRYGFDHATGIDTSERVISDAEVVMNAQVEAGKRNKISFIQGDIRNEAVRSSLDVYDIVTANSVIHLMKSDEAALFLRSAAALVKPREGLLAIATKTLRSGDTRPFNEGGKSLEVIDKGEGYELHKSDDGLERFYYAPEIIADMMAATGFPELRTTVVTTPYGSVEDCEFVIAVAL
jgi:hypothetical protein